MDLATLGFLFLIIVFFIVYHLLQKPAEDAARVGPESRTPTIPFPVDDFTITESLDGNGLRFLCGHDANTTIRYANAEDLTRHLSRMLSVLGHRYIPNDARVISCKMEGFEYGSEFHEFIPNHGEAPGCYYTYQIYGDQRFQVTRYVENGESYVAGFCIYIPDPQCSTVRYREDVVVELKNLPKYKVTGPTRLVNQVTQSTETTWLLEPESAPKLLRDPVNSEQWNVQFCSKFGRDVMSTLADGTVYHKEYNQVVKRMTTHMCAECTKHVEEDLPPSYSSIAMA